MPGRQTERASPSRARPRRQDGHRPSCPPALETLRSERGARSLAPRALARPVLRALRVHAAPARSHSRSTPHGKAHACPPRAGHTSPAAHAPPAARRARTPELSGRAPEVLGGDRARGWQLLWDAERGRSRATRLAARPDGFAPQTSVRLVWQPPGGGSEDKTQGQRETRRWAQDAGAAERRQGQASESRRTRAVGGTGLRGGRRVPLPFL